MHNEFSMAGYDRIKTEYPIDFVVTFVDGNDPVWREKMLRYRGGDAEPPIKDHRSWDNLHYWFRCVAMFAPWVNRIFLVTDHQIPSWLNTDHSKIVAVDHKDFIPEKYLPVFSPNPIELNLHRITGLSEHFVYFNDDTFITSEVEPEYFFRDGLPCDYAVESPFISKDPLFSHILSNDVALINTKYDRRRVLYEHRAKFYSMSYPEGRRQNLIFSMLRTEGFFGFENLHMPSPFLKSAYEAVWNEFPTVLETVCQNRFRSDSDVNQYIVRYWQYLNGMFFPDYWGKTCKFIRLGDADDKDSSIMRACEAIRDQNIKLICLNDTTVEHFDEAKTAINSAFDSIVHNVCGFETVPADPVGERL